MSDKNAKEAEKSNSNIKESVKKLEILFDKLYSGTFSIVQETVSDMRKHVYSQGIEKKEITKEIQDKTKKTISEAVNEIKSNQKSEEELKELIHSVINKTKKVEENVKSNVLRKEIIDFLKKNGRSTFPVIRDYLRKKGILNEDDNVSLFQELKSLSNEKVVNDPFEITDDGYDSISHEKPFYLL